MPVMHIKQPDSPHGVSTIFLRGCISEGLSEVAQHRESRNLQPRPGAAPASGSCAPVRASSLAVGLYLNTLRGIFIFSPRAHTHTHTHQVLSVSFGKVFSPSVIVMVFKWERKVRMPQ